MGKPHQPTKKTVNAEYEYFVHCHYSAEGTEYAFTGEVSIGNTNFVCDVSIFFPYSILITIIILLDVYDGAERWLIHCIVIVMDTFGRLS